MKLFTIDTGNFMADGGALFGVIPKSMWQKKYPADENNYCNLSMRCLLIDTGDRRVLIDTGAGTKQSDKFFSHFHLNGQATLATSINKAGYTFDDITDVILTHLHWDHCGACVYFDDNQQAQITFKNAKHWVSKSQWQNYLYPNQRERAAFFPENMMPVYEAGLIQQIEDNSEIIPGIEVLIYDGHTKGNMVPIIHTPNGLLAFVGDVIPIKASLELLWIPAYDTHPLTSLKDKQHLLDRAIKEHITLFFEHDIETECCSIEQKGQAIKVNKSFSLSAFTNKMNSNKH